jgi:alkanesulfonate monooxygenase SsuD/methylene tetrahydromethanopterin reductase-like flavin-dependent oxidoreductase (luciferase family)
MGFARAFLLHEFHRFGVDVDESVARFDEGVEQITRLLEEENVTMEGRFHSIRNITSLPRPVQKRMPYWTAAIATKSSFEKAGRLGHSIMAIPMAGGTMTELLGAYREAWRSAGHPGNGRVMLAFHMCCRDKREDAIMVARDNLNRYLDSLVSSASEWISGGPAKDYPNYDKIIAKLKEDNFDKQLASGVAWVGEPDELIERIRDYDRKIGGFEIASMQVNFNMMSYEDAAESMKLFGTKVIPHFADTKAAAAE